MAAPRLLTVCLMHVIMCIMCKKSRGVQAENHKRQKCRLWFTSAEKVRRNNWSGKEMPLGTTNCSFVAYERYICPCNYRHCCNKHATTSNCKLHTDILAIRMLRLGPGMVISTHSHHIAACWLAEVAS